MIGETLLLKREPTNPRDKNAVALYKDDAVVRHVPYNLAPNLSRFLARDVNKAFAYYNIIINNYESRPQTPPLRLRHWLRKRARPPGRPLYRSKIILRGSIGSVRSSEVRNVLSLRQIQSVP